MSSVVCSLCVAAGHRLYGNVVDDDVDAANYSQQLRELQNFIVPPQQQQQQQQQPAHSASVNKLPLCSVMSLPEETAMRVCLIQLL